MSWNEYLMDRACKTAGRRRRMYDLEPSPDVASLLAQEDRDINFQESLRLFVYVLSKSPLRRLKLLWRYLADRDTPVRRYRIEQLAQELQSRMSESCRVILNFFERRNYSQDLARVPPLMEKLLYRTTPALVIQPGNEQDVIEVLAFSRTKGLAIFPRGTGSFAFGGSVPTRSGIVLDLSPMMAILEVDPERQTVRVQPGARWADIAAKLEPFGLALNTTPTSHFSTVAGWISTGGIGIGSYGYGSVSESVLEVRVVRPDGTVEELKSKSESMKEFFGTEGQFGILTEITLRVRPKTKHSGTYLLTYPTPSKAFEAIAQLNADGHSPSHVVYFDKEYMIRENILFSEQTKAMDPIVPDQDAVLVHFETPESENEFLNSLNGGSKQVYENNIAARYLWADRYFPLKAQRLGPGLLGSEVVVPQKEVPRYSSQVRSLARRFKLDPAIEVIVCKEGEAYSYLVIVSFRCDYSRSIHYVLSLLFIQLLVRLAVRRGGFPYGVGIWNTPFLKSKYDPARLKQLKERKHEIDPEQTLNPNKFFKIKGRFFNIPALFMRPMIFRMILAICNFFAPVLGIIARLVKPKPRNQWDVPSKEDEQGQSLLHQCAQRCTWCGACISVCPAYHITQDELVTGRAKLRMAETMMNGGELRASEAHSPFQCLHCGLCEEVCQTHLPLRDCYLVLEDWIERRVGSPTETVQGFVEKLDSNRDYIKDVFGLDLPDWTPDKPVTRVPAAERLAEEVKK